jgi:hypothetical protein
MISAFSFIDQLSGLGYSQYAGVPCSFLTSLINYVIGDPALDYIGADERRRGSRDHVRSVSRRAENGDHVSELRPR